MTESTLPTEAVQLVNPPVGSTHMVQPEQTVKARVLRAFEYKGVAYKESLPGEFVELPRSIAQEVSKWKSPNVYDFTGERATKDVKPQVIKYIEPYVEIAKEAF